MILKYAHNPLHSFQWKAEYSCGLALATCFWQIECDFWTLPLGSQLPLCEEAHGTWGGCVLTYSPDWGWGLSQQLILPTGHGSKKPADDSSCQSQADPAENEWNINKLPYSYCRFVSEKKFQFLKSLILEVFTYAAVENQNSHIRESGGFSFHAPWFLVRTQRIWGFTHCKKVYWR